MCVVVLMALVCVIGGISYNILQKKKINEPKNYQLQENSEKFLPE